MNATRKCPRCGTELPANIPEEQCPKCLLAFGIDTQPAAANPSNPTDPAKSPPPSVADLALRFPQLEILEFLGQGGMGLVYRARQLSLDRLVALKILPVDKSEERNFAERFTQEARALARLNHPNIVAVYDFGQADGLCYLLMEYVDGMNLRQLERSGGVTPQEALKIIPAICDALQYAHSHGIVHRDIKPDLATVSGARTGTRANTPADPEILPPTDPEVTRWLAAQRSVRGPAIGLLVTGILNWILIPVFGHVGAALASRLEVAHVPFLWPLLALMVISGFMIYAALEMKAVEAWGAAIAGSILAILISPGNWVGLLSKPLPPRIRPSPVT